MRNQIKDTESEFDEATQLPKTNIKKKRQTLPRETICSNTPTELPKTDAKPPETLPDAPITSNIPPELPNTDAKPLETIPGTPLTSNIPPELPNTDAKPDETITDATLNTNTPSVLPKTDAKIAERIPDVTQTSNTPPGTESHLCPEHSTALHSPTVGQRVIFHAQVHCTEKTDPGEKEDGGNKLFPILMMHTNC